MQNTSNKIAILGAGAAGMLAAGLCGGKGASVTVFEKNDKPGRKLAITGKGRCNLCNNCKEEEFIEKVISNPRFLYTAINKFPPQKVMEFFEGLGVSLVTERGRRVFPQSGKAYEIVDALRAFAEKNADIKYSAPAKSIKKNGDGSFTVLADKEYTFDRVIIATGGKSYPLTGSTGDGYRFAESLGHTVITPKASLVPIEAKNKAECAKMMGLALKNVAITVTDDKKGKLYEDFGEILFTHFGISGPMILSASGYIKADRVANTAVIIDLKPALDEKTLGERVMSDFEKNLNRDFANSLTALLPAKMIPVFVERTGIDPHKKINSVTKEERRKVIHLLKHFDIPLSRFRPIEEAIITQGGIKISEIDPKTMGSKKTSGLYFAGEIIDCDAHTGGYNLQIAFSTAYLAANACCGES